VVSSGASHLRTGVHNKSLEYVWPVVSGRYRPYPRSMWKRLEGPKPWPGWDDEGRSNGATWAPDSILGKRVWPAAVIHDFHYNSGGILPRRVADAVFRRNTKNCLEWDGVPPFFSGLLSLLYYLGVRTLGRGSYNEGDP